MNADVHLVCPDSDDDTQLFIVIDSLPWDRLLYRGLVCGVWGTLCVQPRIPQETEVHLTVSWRIRFWYSPPKKEYWVPEGSFGTSGRCSLNAYIHCKKFGTHVRAVIKFWDTCSSFSTLIANLLLCDWIPVKQTISPFASRESQAYA